MSTGYVLNVVISQKTTETIKFESRKRANRCLRVGVDTMS